MIYDDRLELTSAGSLHFGLTLEKLFVPHESRPWNPLIARAFHRRGIIEEWRLKMTDLTSAVGLPMLEIEDDGWCLTVRFRHGQFVPKPGDIGGSSANRRAEVLALLNRAEKGLTRRDIHARLGTGVSERQVRRALVELRDRRLVATENRGPLTSWLLKQRRDRGLKKVLQMRH